MLASDTVMKPSEYGFRNIRPRTRKERVSLKDKVALEKARISQRVGHTAKMQRENAPETSAALTSCPVSSAGYLSNADRFHTDTAGEQYQLRQIEIEKKKKAEEFRRNLGIQREEERWRHVDELREKEAERIARLREDGNKAKKNQSAAAYDVVNLQYHNDVHGEQQKYLDDMVKYRAKMRTKTLVERGDTRVEYNIISGVARDLKLNPQPVPKPESMLNGYISDRVDRRRMDYSPRG